MMIQETLLLLSAGFVGARIAEQAPAERTLKTGECHPFLTVSNSVIKIYKFKGSVQRYCLYIPTSDKLQHRSTWFLKPLKTGECQPFLTISNAVIRIYKFKGQVQRYCLYIPTSDKLKHRSTWFLNDNESYNSHETHCFRFNTV